MIEISGLSKVYSNGHRALTDVTTNFREGEVCVLLGHNGAGKTTLFKILLNLVAPTQGTATVDDVPLQKTIEVNRRIGYLSEKVSVYEDLTAMQNLVFFGRLGNNGSAATEELLKVVGLDPRFFHQRVASFSKGMRQRLGLAIMLAKEAKYLLLDEPTTGLDPRSVQDLRALTVRLKAMGKGLLIATHDLYFAREVADRILVLREGVLVSDIASDKPELKDLETFFFQ